MSPAANENVDPVDTTSQAELEHFVEWSGGFYPYECSEEEIEAYIRCAHRGVFSQPGIKLWMERALNLRPHLK